MIITKKDVDERKAEALDALGATLDRESYDWLWRNQRDIADDLEAAVAAGATVGEIKRLAWSRTSRPEIVQRIESAARHLWSNQ